MTARRAVLEAVAAFVATLLLLCAPAWISGWLLAAFGVQS